jgi:DNA-binding SARP family transcriptional activator/TolA-binding protein
MSLTLNVLGRLEIGWEGEPVAGLTLRKCQALLIYLALNPGCHDRSHLAGLLWGDLPETNARRNLRHALHRLRSGVDPALLACDRLTAGLAPEVAVRVDALALEAALDEADRRRRAGAPEAVMGALAEAADLYRGDFLHGFDAGDALDFEVWAAGRRAHLRGRFLEALDRLVTYWTERGAYARALRYARRQLDLEPLWETAHRHVMTLLALTGQRSAALSQFRACRTILDEELGLAPLPETTALYRAIQRADFARRQPQDAGRAARALPFVGRGEEHAALVAAWQAARWGEGRLTLVEGEAGLGKTRLLEEVLRYAETQGAVTLRGRCYEFGGGLPYQPIAQALRAYLRRAPWRPKSGPCGQRQRAAGVAGELPGIRDLPPIWLAELSRLLPDVHQYRDDLPPVPVASGEAARQRLFEAVARLLGALAAVPVGGTEGAPVGVALFLDDLHWADASTLDLLHYLIRYLAGAPVWLVGTYRPEEISPDHPLTRLRQGLSRDHQVVRLALRPLSPAAVRALVQALAGCFTSDDREGEALVAYLWRESEGNPFILSEIISGLQEGDLRSATAPMRAPAREALHVPPEGARVLPGVQAMILQRVGRLAEPARRLLAFAAAAGRAFEVRLLSAAAGMTAEEVDAALDQWLARRLVATVVNGGAPESGAVGLAEAGHRLYDFTHDKIRAAVYCAAGPDRQRRLHRRLGEALEILWADDPAPVYEALAYHFERAGEVEKALTYLPLAAAKAAGVYANEQALTTYRRALALCPPVDERRWDILLHQAEIFRLVGRYAAALAACRQVIEGLDAAPGAPRRRTWQSRAYRGLAQIYRIQRDYAAARRCAEAGERLVREALAAYRPDADGMDGGAGVEHAHALRVLGEIEREQTRLTRARELFEEALALYRALEDDDGTARTLMGLGDILSAQGRYDAARRRYASAVATFRKLADKQNAALCLRGIGMAHWRLRDYDASRQATLESLALCEATGDRRGEAASLKTLGLLALVQGDHAETQERLNASIALYKELGLEKRTAPALHNLGISYMECGRMVEAREALAAALAINRDTRVLRDQALDLGWLGKLHWLLHDEAAAAAYLDEALTLDRESGGGEEEDWHVVWRLGVAYELGDLAGARDYLRRAEALVAQGCANLKAHDVAYWQGRLQLAEGRCAEAGRTARQALAMGEADGADARTQGDILVLLGRCLGADGEDAASRRAFERALALLGDGMATAYNRAAALHHYGAYLAARGEDGAARSCTDEARCIFAQMGVPVAETKEDG